MHLILFSKGLFISNQMQYSIVGVYIPILSEVVVGLDISEIKSIHDHPMFAGKLQETESLDINLNVEQNNIVDNYVHTTLYLICDL